MSNKPEISEKPSTEKRSASTAVAGTPGTGVSGKSVTAAASFATYLWAAAISAAIGFGAVYVIAGGADNGTKLKTVAAPPSAPAGTRGSSSLTAAPDRTTAGQEAGADAQTSRMTTTASKVNPLSTGKMINFVFKKTPAPLPEIAFTDGEGKPKSLKDWRGKVVLLNLWATWCAPCRREMPDLDKLQGELGSDKFEVVALSVDRKGIKASKRFLEQIKVKHLKLFNDATMRSSSKLRAIGMPTTLLIDAEGREIGRLVGPAEWHSDDAKRLIKAQL